MDSSSYVGDVEVSETERKGYRGAEEEVVRGCEEGGACCGWCCCACGGGGNGGCTS